MKRYAAPSKEFSFNDHDQLFERSRGWERQGRLSISESYMADNDLALGRVVRYLSHLRMEKNDDRRDGG